MIRRNYSRRSKRFLHESLFREIQGHEAYPYAPLSDNSGPYRFEDPGSEDDNSWFQITVCGHDPSQWDEEEYDEEDWDEDAEDWESEEESQITTNDVVVDITGNRLEGQYTLFCSTISDAMSVGERLAGIYTRKGLKATKLEMDRLGFEQIS